MIRGESEMGKDVVVVVAVTGHDVGVEHGISTYRNIFQFIGTTPEPPDPVHPLVPSLGGTMVSGKGSLVLLITKKI